MVSEDRAQRGVVFDPGTSKERDFIAFQSLITSIHKWDLDHLPRSLQTSMVANRPKDTTTNISPFRGRHVLAEYLQLLYT